MIVILRRHLFDVWWPQLGLLLLGSVILDGAWLGFWAVRKFILTEDGSVDTKTAQFVEWSIQIVSALLLLQVVIYITMQLIKLYLKVLLIPFLACTILFQSSVDQIMAIEALVFGITVSSILRRMFRLRIVRRVYRQCCFPLLNLNNNFYFDFICVHFIQ